MEESWDQTTHFDLKRPLADSLDEIEIEFDELRSLIGSSLRDYEERLRQISQGVPKWTKTSAEKITKRFLCPALGPFGGVLLGPRAAAAVAGKVEEEIRRWFEPRFHLEEPCPWVSLGSRIDELDATLVAAQNDVRRFVVHLGDDLGKDLESILEKLDEVRSSDLDALRSGEAGPNVEADREKAAQTWEMQRRKAAEVREAWGPIELLAFEGADWTVEGTRHLQTILRRAATLLKVLYPELNHNLPTLELSSEPTGVLGTWETEKLTPSGSPNKGSGQSDPTRPLIERRPKGAVAKTNSRPLSKTQSKEERENRPARSSFANESPVSIEAKIERTSLGWSGVGGVEILLVVGLPLMWLATLVCWSSVRTLVPAASAIPSPAHGWGVASFALASLWLLAAPLLRGWKIGVTHGRRHVVRLIREEVEAVLRVDEDGALWPDHKYRLQDLSSSLQRWESEDDGIFGWSLTVLKEHSACAVFFAPERNYTTWNQSQAPLVTLDPDAWQITPRGLQQIQESLAPFRGQRKT